jgi:hypothetical protein
MQQQQQQECGKQQRDWVLFRGDAAVRVGSS